MRILPSAQCTEVICIMVAAVAAEVSAATAEISVAAAAAAALVEERGCSGGGNGGGLRKVVRAWNTSRMIICHREKDLLFLAIRVS